MNATDNATSEPGNFTISEHVIGPLLAAFVALEMILAVLANSFILIFSLCNPRNLRKASTVLFLSLSLSNLFLSVAFMPFTVITAGAGEWIFGANEEEKSSFCSLVGFVFSLSVWISACLLSAISFDRFLFIVKPIQYRQIMKPWVGLLTVLGIVLLSTLFNIAPFIGLGEYAFAPITASCIPIWLGNADYLIYITVGSTIPLGIILITTIWTFLFTRRFIKENYKRQRGASLQSEDSVQNSVYNYRLRNLFGIFGMLMVVNAISFLPFIVLSVVGMSVGFHNVPAFLYTVVFVLFLFNNVANPLVQSYFRKELWQSALLFGRRLRTSSGLIGDRNKCTHPTRMSTVDDPLCIQSQESRNCTKTDVAEMVTHGEEMTEPKELNLSQLLDSTNRSTACSSSNCSDEANPKTATQESSKVPLPFTYTAKDDDSADSKPEKRKESIKSSTSIDTDPLETVHAIMEDSNF